MSIERLIFLLHPHIKGDASVQVAAVCSKVAAVCSKIIFECRTIVPFRRESYAESGVLLTPLDDAPAETPAGLQDAENLCWHDGWVGRIVNWVRCHSHVRVASWKCHCTNLVQQNMRSVYHRIVLCFRLLNVNQMK